jgi:hypothetical protein
MLEPIVGRPVRFPPGRLEVRLDERHRSAYRELYRRYRTMLTDMPVLRDRDFDGRAVKLTKRQFEALNEGFAGLVAPVSKRANEAFAGQESSRTRLFKRTQYLS